MRKSLLVAAVLVFPAAAHAQNEPLRDVSYFIAHTAEARATRQICHNNAAYARLPTCQNAERAGRMSDLQQLAELHRGGAEQAATMLDDPAYWSQNPIARGGVLAQCRRAGPGDQMVLPYCQAAAASALHDIARR